MQNQENFAHVCSEQEIWICMLATYPMGNVGHVSCTLSGCEVSNSNVLRIKRS